ncbi:MAG: hypothetical protein JSW33_16965 [bacterium]|nr:MAG: hypothetical protein JSW33_16965 [bacterium]
MRIVLIFGIMLGLLLADAESSSELITVRAEVDKAVITIGDRITYALTIEYESHLKIEQPGPGANLGQFEIKDYTIHEPLKKDGMISQTFDYEISVFDTGTFSIPPFPVAFAESDTSRDYQIIQSEPIEITVNSVLTAEDSEIRDLKPPLDIPANYGRLVITGVIIIISVVLIFSLLYYFRWRKKGIPLFRREPVRPAHEIALHDLGTLAEEWRELYQQGEFKQIYTRISEILRRYLENRYFVKALEETTAEIRDSLTDINLETELQNQVMEVLEYSDLVKFAKYVPSEENIQANLKSAESFIHSTKLVFEKFESDEKGEQGDPGTAPELQIELEKSDTV